ncbi:transmembrane protein 252 [Molossus molossus]|uniref:Transmembrane protein 252 n=1 Tax=Molossus molossus TaxID=27622 RepID=A0A7J8EH55_MOLMO|nr:transmembrane protein 252 [Molossus molossus]KAF6434651.1 transmembrane protein 252 [Molossus molossus]
MRNRTGAALCALAPPTGFLIICLGAFFISSGSTFGCQRNLILAYLLLPLGFVILVSGIFWSTYRQASENKGLFSHVLRSHLVHGATALATVDRPDFYPPAYEESLDAEKQTCPAEGEALDIPPPLYTEMDLELEGENDAHPEAPPSYDESVVARAAAATPSQDAQGQSREC